LGGEKCQTLLSDPSPLLLINNIFKGQAHLVYFIALYLKILASWQNIKNLIGSFEAFHVGIMHAKFQASSFTGVIHNDVTDTCVTLVQIPIQNFKTGPLLWEG